MTYNDMIVIDHNLDEAFNASNHELYQESN